MRTVTENSQTLKFTSSGFEEDKSLQGAAASAHLRASAGGVLGSLGPVGHHVGTRRNPRILAVSGRRLATLASGQKAMSVGKCGAL